MLVAPLRVIARRGRAGGGIVVDGVLVRILGRGRGVALSMISRRFLGNTLRVVFVTGGVLAVGG